MKNSFLRPAAAVLSVLSVLTVFSACGRDLGDLTEPDEQNAQMQDETVSGDRPTIIVTLDGEQYSILQAVPGLLETTQNASPTVPNSSAAAQNAAPSATAPAASQAGGNTAASPLSYSKDELVAYFNSCANKIKTNKPSFTKEEQSGVSDIVLSNSLANSLVGVVKDALLDEDVVSTPVAKGQDCNGIVSPEGQSYVSTITSADIADITIQPAGNGYTMTVTMPEATNPEDSGPYGKIFQFVSVDDVLNDYAPEVGATVARENITLRYTGSTATLTIDASGNPTEYSTHVNCVVTLKDASIKKGITINSDVDLTLVTDTKLTGFGW